MQNVRIDQSSDRGCGNNYGVDVRGAHRTNYFGGSSLVLGIGVTTS